MSSSWEEFLLVCDSVGVVESATPVALKLATDPKFVSTLGAAVRTFVACERTFATAGIEGLPARLTLVVAMASVRVVVSAASVRVVVTLRADRLGASESLTPAQRRVAELASLGATAKEIASALGTSPATVRTQLRDTYRRLGVSSRVELARALGVV